jgi:hypothetical protein
MAAVETFGNGLSHHRGADRIACLYCADVPQISDLGHYRPISNTVVYDDEGRQFATLCSATTDDRPLRGLSNNTVRCGSLH